MNLITSRNNPKIKEVRLLRQAKERRTSGLCLVEGIWHTTEAIEAWLHGGFAEVIHLFYAPELLTSESALHTVEEAAGHGLPCYKVTGEVFRSMAEKDNPQGLLAVVKPFTVRLEELNPSEHPWVVALVEPQDPGNIGSILRTLDAAGASALLLLDGGADPFQAECIRASMGTIFWIPVVRSSFEKMLNWAEEGDYTIYGTSAHAVRDYHEVERYQKPCVLLFGSERQGLTQPQRAACHEIVRLPMSGRVTSLNLAVAAGIVLYQVRGK